MCFACLLVGVVDYLLTQLPPLPTSTQSPSPAALASSTLSSVSLWLCIHVLWLFSSPALIQPPKPNHYKSIRQAGDLRCETIPRAGWALQSRGSRSMYHMASQDTGG